MRILWIPLGAAMLFAQPASAQTAKQPHAQPQQNQSLQDAASEPSPAIGQQLRDNLQRSGFTNVQVVPQSFLIRAHDPQGNPITMVVSPDMVAGVAVQENTGALSGRSVSEGAGTKFIAGPVHDAAEWKFEGTAVWSSDNQKIGDITGIGLGDNGSLSYIVSRQNGGDIAIAPTAMSLTYNQADDNWDARVNASASQIGSAPQVQYSND